METLKAEKKAVEVKEEVLDINVNGVVLKLTIPDMSKLERAILDKKYVNKTVFKMDLSKYRKEFKKDATFQIKVLNGNVDAENSNGGSKVKTY